MCKKCLDFLMEHFYMGYTPDEALILYKTSQVLNEENVDHLMNYLGNMLAKPELLFKTYKKWNREHRSVCQTTVLNDEDELERERRGKR